MPHNAAQRLIHEERGGAQIACLGKVTFPDPMTAAKVAKRMTRAKHSRITTFRCPFCSKWHVGRNLGIAPRVRRL